MLFRVFLVIAACSAFKQNYNTAALGAKMSIIAVDFEVFGRVQGVFFRKYTKEQATKLGLRGWCKNTAKGTVQGHIQGPEDSMETMMNWLREVGSPASEISKAVFRNQQTITELNFNDFSIRRE